MLGSKTSFFGVAACRQFAAMDDAMRFTVERDAHDSESIVAISISVQPLRTTEKMSIKYLAADSKVSTWEFNTVESPSELTRRRKVAHIVAGVARCEDRASSLGRGSAIPFA